MKIEMWPLDRIEPYAGNPRKNHTAVEAVAHSIEEFGFRQPIVVDTGGVVIIGHTRLFAARMLGLTQVPVHVAGELSAAQVKALRIADNKLHEIADWDFDRLSEELMELQELEVNLELLGFSQEELAQLWGEKTTEGLTDPDDVPEPPDEPTTQPGDLWLLGEHRLLCGDAGNADHVDRLLDGSRVQIVNTDPPYNVRLEPRSNNAIAAGLSSFQATHHQRFDAKRHPSKSTRTSRKMRAKDRPLKNDFVSAEQFEEMLRAWFRQMARVLEAGRAFFVWGGYANCANYPRPLAECGLYFSQAIIWVKEHPVLTRKDFMGNHEWCFYGWREGAAHQFFGAPNTTDVWSVKKVTPQQMIHLTEKPVELAVRALHYSSRRGEHVLDLFGGSGSTLIAAEQTGRKAFLMELDPAYCDVILTRWERFTGKKANRETAGQEALSTCLPQEPSE